ncbi:MAG: DnaJ domain-containing protein [Spirochaetales bacterium]|nr:DnaJ domain-containing protein [Spirochaetales bacterium]
MIPSDNDFSIFNINKKSSLSDLKKSYRFLLKKYHPDLNSGGREYDLKIISIINAYQRLLKYFSLQNLSQHGDSPQTNHSGSNDSVYSLYKKGLYYYDKLFSIDPLDWLKLRRAEIAGKRNESNSVHKDTLIKLDELLFNTSRAIYYFSIIVEDYPDSSWTADSRSKINILNRNLKNYMKTKQFHSKRG